MGYDYQMFRKNYNFKNETFRQELFKIVLQTVKAMFYTQTT